MQGPLSSHPQNLKNSPKQLAKMVPLSRTLNSRMQPKTKMVRATDSTRAWQRLPEVSAKSAKTITIIDNKTVVKVIKYNHPKAAKASNNQNQMPQQPKKKLQVRMEETMMEAITSVDETTNETEIIDAGATTKVIAAKEAMVKATAEMAMAKVTIIIIVGAIGSEIDAIEMQTLQSITRRRRRAGRSARSRLQTRQQLQQATMREEVTAEEAVAVNNDRTETTPGNPKARMAHLPSSTETNASTTRIKGRMAVKTAEVVEEEVVVDEAAAVIVTTKMTEVNLLEEVAEVIEETM